MHVATTKHVFVARGRYFDLATRLHDGEALSRLDDAIRARADIIARVGLVDKISTKLLADKSGRHCWSQVRNNIQEMVSIATFDAVVRMVTLPHPTDVAEQRAEQELERKAMWSQMAFGSANLFELWQLQRRHRSGVGCPFVCQS